MSAVEKKCRLVRDQFQPAGMLRVFESARSRICEASESAVTRLDESRLRHYRSDVVRAVRAKHSRSDCIVSNVTQNLPSCVVFN